MYKRRANRFEASVQRAAQGETVEGDLAPLVHTARSIASVRVPPPPRGLAEGRRQLMAEAARLTPHRRVAWHFPGFAFSKMRLATVAVSLLVVLVLLPGFTHAIATSSNGSPLYPLKVLGQEARLWLTSNPEEIADIQVAMAEEQLDDIVASLEQGRPIDSAVANRVETRLSLALNAVSQSGDTPDPAPKLRLMNVLQITHSRIMEMISAGLDSEQEPLHNLMRQMERARRELEIGSGNPGGEQERAREGEPPEDQEFGPHGPAGSAPAAHKTPAAGGSGASDPGSASNPPGGPAESSGPANGAAGDPPSHTPAPVGPAATPDAPPANGENQQQPHGGSDGNRSRDHR